MPTFDTTLAFLTLSLLLGFTPGPDNVFVVMQSATHGRKAGLYVVLGLCTGLLVHTLAVALGLAALFAASALAFSVLKYAGAAYLLYLAWQAYRAPMDAAGEPVSPAVRPAVLYRRAIVMNLTNPKVVMFFLAFLPQFVDPTRGAMTGQLVGLGLLFIAATLVSFGCLTWLAGSFGRLLRSSAIAQKVMNRLAALVFAGLAVRLATSQR